MTEPEPVDVAELRRRLAAMPAGRLYVLGAPWAINSGPPVILLGSDDPHAADVVLCGQDIDEWPADERGPDYTRQDRVADLAVAAVNALGPLLDRLEAAEARVAELDASAEVLASVIRAGIARVAALETALRAAMRACDRIDHDVSYQTVICALVPVPEWRALTALLEEE